MSHFYNLTTIQDNHLVKVQKGMDSMCYHDHGAATEKFPYDPLDFDIYICVQTRPNRACAETSVITTHLFFAGCGSVAHLIQNSRTTDKTWGLGPSKDF